VSIVDEIFDLYDIDCSQGIEESELVDYFHQLRARLLCGNSSTDGTDSFMVKGDDILSPYIPQEIGKIQCHVKRFGMYFHEAMSIRLHSLDEILTLACKSREPLSTVEQLLPSIRLCYEGSLRVYKLLSEYGGDSVSTLAKVVVYTASPGDVRRFILSVISTCAANRCRLKEMLRYCYRPLINVANGFYHLDLHNAMDRICLLRLRELSNSGANFRVNNSLEDISEHGNWSGFRNCYVNGLSVCLDDGWFDKIPVKGRLDFDFVTYYSPEKKLPLSTKRFISVLKAAGVCSADDDVDCRKSSC
jgi:hypothetical protein